MSAQRVASVGPPESSDEIHALAAILRQSFGRNEDEQRSWLDRASPDTVRVVRRRGEVAGGLTLLRMGQWYGARSVPMAGIAAVGIAPEHRATGAATALMRATLDELHGEGVAVSTLFPSTLPLYRKLGYERAGLYVNYRIPTRTIDVRDRTLEVRPADKSDHETIRALYTRQARHAPGNLDRSPVMWRRLWEPPGQELHAYVVAGAGGPLGYVAFTQGRDRSWRYDLRVRDMTWTTPEAGRRILALFADHRSLAQDVGWHGPPADPLLYLLAEHDWESPSYWTWMLRVVDVRGALGARGYPPGVDAEMHLEVRDDVLGWNAGRFLVQIADGKASVRKGGRGRLRLGVGALAPLFTGLMTPVALAQAGMIEGTERELATAARAFGGPAPWMADFF